MKRKEALNIIDRVYGEWAKDVLSTTFDEDIEFVPLNERILTALEKAGMLPPEHNFGLDGENCWHIRNKWEKD